MKNSHGLKGSEIKIIKDIFALFRSKITNVALFGSRATGKFRNNSDIDLVVYGEIGEGDVDRIWTLFDNCNLAYKVDIVGYNLITNPELKIHIDKFMVPLFTQADLTNTEAKVTNLLKRVGKP
jgi:predicted nucleotidyltransferase